MSGSSGGGDNIKVTITGDASDFNAAADAAADAAQRLANTFVMTGDVLKSSGNKFVGAGTDVTSLAQAYLSAGVSVQEVAKQLGLTIAPAAQMAQASSEAAARMTSLGQASQQSVPLLAASAEEAAKLEATIQRLMTASASAAPSTNSMAAGVSSVGTAGAQAAPQIDATAAATARIDATAQAALASMNGASAAGSNMGRAAAQAAPQIEGSAEAAKRLDEAVRGVVAGSAGFASGATQGATAADRLAGSASDAANSENRLTGATNAAGAAILTTGTRWVRAGEDVRNLALALIRAGATAQEITRNLGITAEALRELTNSATAAGGALQNADRIIQETSGDLNKIEPGANTARTGLAGMAREIIVIGHEAMTGNFSRIPGSLIVLAERSGALTEAIAKMATQMSQTSGIGVSAFAALGIAVGAFAYKAYEAARALRELASAANFLGRNSAEAVADFTKGTNALQDQGLSKSDADAWAANAQKMIGSTREIREQYMSLGAAIKAGNPTADITELSNALVNAWNGGVSGIDTYIQHNGMMTESRMRDLAAAKTQNDTLAAGAILMKALQDRTAGYNSEVAKRNADDALLNPPGMDAPARMGFMKPTMQLPPSPLEGAKEVDPSLLREAQIEQDLLKTESERVALTRSLAEMRERAAKAGNPEDRARAERAAAEVEAQLANLTTGAQQEAYRKVGDAARDAGLAAARAAQESGKTRLQVTEAQQAAELQIYQKAAHDQALSDRQRADLNRQAQSLELSLTKENAAKTSSVWTEQHRLALSEIEKQVSAHATNVKQRELDLLNTRIKFWHQAAAEAGATQRQIDDANKYANEAQIQLDGKRLSFGAAAAKKGVLDQLSALNEEQAAVRENFAQVMQIEDRKIALLTAAGAQYTQKLNEERAKQLDLQRQHATEMIHEAERQMREIVQIDNQDIAQKRADLEQDVAEDRISKATMLRTLAAFIAQKRAMEAQAGAAFAAGLDTQSKAYETFVRQLNLDAARAATEQRQLATQASKDVEQQWQNALSPISSAFSSSIDGVIQGTQTLQQAVANMAQSIILSYLKMSIDADTKWAASQLAQVFSTQTAEAGKTGAAATGAAARGTIAASEGAGEQGGLAIRLGRFIATQLGMTGTQAAQTATRTATVATGEVAQTAAVAAGAAAQEAAKATAKAAGSAVSVATGSASVMNSAYEAAAGTYASVAQIPYVGWILAPGAAAAAFAAVAAFNSMKSFAVGAWNLPGDTIAQLHAGEMVVPANFATGLRGALTGGGGGGGGSMAMHYSPTINAGGGGTRDMDRMLARSNDRMKANMLDMTRNGALKLPGR